MLLLSTSVKNPLHLNWRNAALSFIHFASVLKLLYGYEWKELYCCSVLIYINIFFISIVTSYLKTSFLHMAVGEPRTRVSGAEAQANREHAYCS